MRAKTLTIVALAASLTTSACAGNGSDDTAGALLLGAAVVGIGLLAVTAGDSDDNDRHDRDRYDRRDYGHRKGYGGGYDRDYRSDRRYANNGQCDDPRYRTSNGGRAERGSDERDCRRYGDGRK